MTALSATIEPDQVRANTVPAVLNKIDSTIEDRIQFYATQPREAISQRIMELEQEWDMERWLETNASSLALASLILGVTVNRKWLLLSGGILSFLLMHALQGWCPPVPLLRRLGVRTRGEIDREKFALKVLRGDFQEVSDPEELRRNPGTELYQAVKA